MSSRTATGRKRMEEPHRITARSLFGRSKSKPPPMPPPVPQVPAAARVPPLPHTHGRTFDATEFPQNQTPRPLNVRVDYGGMDGDPFASRSPITPSYSHAPSSQPRSTPATSLRAPSPATYSMQAPSTIPLVTSGGRSYIEVTYQPPPPPSSHSVPDPATFPFPPSYPSPSTSTNGSHFNSSRRSAPNSRAPSRSHSPTPTEPPEYAPLEPLRRGRPALQVTTGPREQPIRPELLQYQSLNSEAYAEQYIVAEEQQSYLPYATGEGPHRTPSFRQSTSGSSPTRSAAHSQFVSSPATRRSAVAPSISEGSESSEFSKGAEKIKKGQPGFVYPGSRSNARPKAKSKKDKDSIKSKGSDKSSQKKGSLPNLRSVSSEDAGSPHLQTGLAPMMSSTSLSSTRSLPRQFIPDAAPPPIPPVPSIVPSISLPPTDSTSSTARTRALSELNSDLRSVFSDDEDDEPPRRPPQQNPSSSTALPPTPKTPSYPAPVQAQAPAFVFPSSRSRAPPIKPLKIKPLNPAKVPGAPLTPISETGSEGKVASRFVERFLKKKKSKNSDTGTVSSGGQDVHGVKPVAANDVPKTVAAHHKEHRYNVNQATIDMESRELARKIKSRIGSYPLDPYDSILLDK